MSVLARVTSPLRSRDPAVRLRAVQKHPADDAETLAEIARRDSDARVRKEAVRRIEAPRVLLSLAEEAGDEAARRLSRSRGESLLVRIAADDRDLEESRRALGLIAPLRPLAEVACRARFEAVREEALGRLLQPVEDPQAAGDREQALAAVAARAGAPDARGRALEAIAGAAGLMQVALRAEVREIAHAAVRRIEDPDALLRVAGSSAPKGVRRLARRRAETRLPADHPERIREREKRLRELLDRLEDADPDTLGEKQGLLAEAETLAASGPHDAELSRRLGAYRETAAARARADAARLAASASPGISPAPQVEETPPAQIEAVRSEPVPDEFPPLLARLQDPESALGIAAVEAAGKEGIRLLENCAEDEPARGRLEEALREARARALDRKKRRIEEFEIAELADHAEALRKSLVDKSATGGGSARRELLRLVRRFEKKNPGESRDAARFRDAAREAETALAARKTAREEHLRKFGERLTALDERLAALEAAETLPAGEAEAALRDLGALRHDAEVWRRVGPARQARFQRRQAALLPRLREARELREWRRWSNLEEQAELIRRARALVSVEDDARVDRELVGLERAWHEARHTDRDQGKELWEEWGEVRGRLLERVAPRREAAERELAEKLDALTAIAARAEEIADSSDSARAAEMRSLMSDWRERAKGAGRKSEGPWKRFRAANDRYFTGLQEARKRRDTELAANIPLREELIKRAGALSGESDERAVRNAVRDLMREWKEAPPVPKKQGDRLWDKFRSICDAARDRQRDAADSDGDGPEAPVGADGAGEEWAAALDARIAELAAAPPADRARAAETVWGECRRLRKTADARSGQLEALRKREAALADCLRAAFEQVPETFAGTRFDQETLAVRLASLLESLKPLARREDRAPAEASVATLAEHLQRTFQSGRPADRQAEAREAARNARQFLERARASGPALSAAAVANLALLEKCAETVISREPPPPDGRERRPGRRAGTRGGGARRQRPNRVQR